MQDPQCQVFLPSNRLSHQVDELGYPEKGMRYCASNMWIANNMLNIASSSIAYYACVGVRLRCTSIALLRFWHKAVSEDLGIASCQTVAHLQHRKAPNFCRSSVCGCAGDKTLELDEALFNRSEDFETRSPKQIAMPAFPTTTIGSFPQTSGAHPPSAVGHHRPTWQFYPGTSAILRHAQDLARVALRPWFRYSSEHATHEAHLPLLQRFGRRARTCGRAPSTTRSTRSRQASRHRPFGSVSRAS